jgi:hypothetical protein
MSNFKTRLFFKFMAVENSRSKICRYWWRLLSAEIDQGAGYGNRGNKPKLPSAIPCTIEKTGGI